MLSITKDLKELYPDAIFGIMTVEVTGNDTDRESFLKLEQEILDELTRTNQNYDRKKFILTEPVCHYVKYYKRFKKTYPVLLQLESILLKGRKIPSAGPLVESMFLSEVKNLLLTAGHDMDKLQLPLEVTVAKGGESFEGMGQKSQVLTKDDMLVKDQEGIISGILNGPDNRTSITTNTTKVLYFVYGTDGITYEQMKQHLCDIKDCLITYLPQITIESLEVLS